MTPSPPMAAAVRAESPARLPTWFGAWHGLWTLTWRSQLTWRRMPLLIGTVIIIPVLALLTLEDGQIEAYLHWMVDFYLMLLLPLYCLSACGAMIRDELQSNTLGFLTTRPLSRARLFLLKYACQMAWLQTMALIVAAQLWGAGVWRDISGVSTFAALFLGVQVLAVLAYGALSALLGLLHQRYLVLGIIYGFVVELGIGKIPTNINNLSLARHVRTLLSNNELIGGYYDWSSEKTWFSAGVMMVAAIVFLILGALLFSWREYQVAEESQK